MGKYYFELQLWIHLSHPITAPCCLEERTQSVLYLPAKWGSKPCSFNFAHHKLDQRVDQFVKWGSTRESKLCENEGKIAMRLGQGKNIHKLQQNVEMVLVIVVYGIYHKPYSDGQGFKTMNYCHNMKWFPKAKREKKKDILS